MAIVTVTSKGQITLPKAIRTRLGLEAGTRVEFVETDLGFLVKPATCDIRALKGILPKPKKPVSVKEMNERISKMGRAR